MNTAIANLIILTAATAGDKIAGTAIDGEIAVKFVATASDLNQRLFVPEANLVVSGKFRLGSDPYSIGISIKSILTVVALPAVAPVEITAPVEATTPVEAPAPVAQTKKRKSTSNRKKTAKTDLVAA
jgi:hypothetical protein